MSGKITDTAYSMWLEEHSANCDANYKGPSGGMEAAAAVKMWGRSTEHNILYRTFESNGDSSAYLSVHGMHDGKVPYGEYRKASKVECINHVAKRLGTALRGLKNYGLIR